MPKKHNLFFSQPTNITHSLSTNSHENSQFPLHSLYFLIPAWLKEQWKTSLKNKPPSLRSCNLQPSSPKGLHHRHRFFKPLTAEECLGLSVPHLEWVRYDTYYLFIPKRWAGVMLIFSALWLKKPPAPRERLTVLE